ncbi:hypothetical protein [Aureispira anguillae]|uniref:Uncharacterized protein n=1 Tax=Aureispira anguillae TaxID=2864201 RepID=A0A915YB40_9BACT|nr:hypothetical protein [Aureispira anguillae]BDS09812.1 hypothetical protein AsAng_0005170 [Aureispira anguillae]
MASSLELFDLIKSLTSNEKRHFRLITELQTGKKNYVRLFEEMDALEVYDKQQIIANLKGNKFLKSLHVTENYLYQRIMESLRTFHADHSIMAKLYNLLLDAELLKGRGFYKLSMEVLNRAEKLAKKQCKNFLLTEIATKKIELIVADRDRLLLEQLDDLYQQTQQNHQQLEEESLYIYWHHWFVLVFRKWRHPKDPQIIQRMEEGYQLVQAQAFPQHGTFQAQYYYYTIQSIYWQIKKDYLKGNAIHAKILEVWEANPSIIKEKLSVYMARLANYINNSLTCQKYELVAVLIQKMEGLKTTSFDEAGEQFQNVYFYKQLYYLNAKQLEAAKDLIPLIEKGVKKYAAKVNPARKLALYYNSTTTLFLLEEYEAAADWLNKILAVSRTHEPRKDVQRFARILQLAIYYKLSSYEVLEYLFRSVYRNKKLKAEMHEFEKIVLHYFKQLIKGTVSEKAEKTLFQAFRAALENLSPIEKNTTGFEEFLIWVNAMC